MRTYKAEPALLHPTPEAAAAIEKATARARAALRERWYVKRRPTPSGALFEAIADIERSTMLDGEEIMGGPFENFEDANRCAWQQSRM